MGRRLLLPLCQRGVGTVILSGSLMALLFLAAPSRIISQGDGTGDLAILGRFSGDYPASELHRLPENQRTSRVGFIADVQPFNSIWEAFMPDKDRPEVDFDSSLVVFFRNVDFYNQVSIMKVTLREGVAEVLAMETMSSLPIEDKVGMAMAVIPSAGVSFIKAGEFLVPVRRDVTAVDPMNATYTIEGQKVRMVDGLAREPAAPGSVTAVTTRVFGRPVTGDLDGDGVEDAAVLLVHDPGGSGTFYYASAVIAREGIPRAANTILIGDRISPQTLSIRNGVFAVNYADRLEGEPMSTPPHMGKTKYMTLADDRLTPIGDLGKGEQVVEGWITTGHEVRSFRPCSGGEDLWLSGDSPALREILEAFDPPSSGTLPYTPRFMVVAGKLTDRPKEGFGEDYDGLFLVTRLVNVPPRGNCSGDTIVIDAPLAGELVTSPLTLLGRARGLWFFEGDFPVMLVDARGQKVAEGYVTAKGPWMTPEFVPFEGTLEFEKAGSPARGTLLFKKDNPGGMPERDLTVEIPVSYR